MLGDTWLERSTVELDSIYDEWFSSLMNERPWSSENPSGRRIPWRQALGSGIKDLDFSGLYFFASEKGVPRYIGKAQRETLRERLSHRYLSGRFSQFHIAADYSDQLCLGGFEALPDEVLAWYLRNQGRRFLARHGLLEADDATLARISRDGMGTKVRLRHAADLARHGVEGIWISLIPASSAQIIPELENNVIRVASEWNRAHGYPPLLNSQGIP